MWIHGLPNGFRDLGHQVQTAPRLSPANIIPLVEEFQPDIVFTMGWTSDNSNPVHQAIIRSYLRAVRTPHLYWATEDPTHAKTFSLPYIQSTRPDLIFTICPERVADYQRLGFRAERLDFGYHPAVHHPVIAEEGFAVPLAVVANAYPNRLTEYPAHYRRRSLATLIQPVLQTGWRIDFWGRAWEQMQPFLGLEIPREWLHGYLDYTEAAQVYAAAAIVIGLQNHPGQLTQRIYEIMGCGGFLLTSDTPEIRRLFEPDRDLVVSATASDTLKLIRYYLRNPEEREAIRSRARRAVEPHSYRHRAQFVLEVLHKYQIG